MCKLAVSNGSIKQLCQIRYACVGFIGASQVVICLIGMTDICVSDVCVSGRGVPIDSIIRSDRGV